MLAGPSGWDWAKSGSFGRNIFVSSAVSEARRSRFAGSP